MAADPAVHALRLAIRRTLAQFDDALAALLPLPVHGERVGVRGRAVQPDPRP